MCSKISAGDPGVGAKLRVMNSRNPVANASVLLARSANGSDDMSERLDELTTRVT